MATTTLDLISNIKLRGSFPTANDLFSNADYLQILNDEMLNQIVPLLNKIQEEYFLTYKDYQITADTSTYRIPKRAIGSTLRDVQMIDSNDTVTSLYRLYEEDKTSTTMGARGYYLKGNQVILSPTPTSTVDTLRMAYFRRPSKFVLPSACAEIIAIAGNIVTVASAPASFSNGVAVDFVQGDTPYDILDFDVQIVGISGVDITFSELPDDLAVGDYISLANQSCLPMVPEELIPILVQSALCACLSSKKDKSVELELQKLEQMKASILGLLQPRVKSNDQKIRVQSGLLRHFRGY